MTDFNYRHLHLLRMQRRFKKMNPALIERCDHCNELMVPRFHDTEYNFCTVECKELYSIEATRVNNYIDELLERSKK